MSKRLDNMVRHRKQLHEIRDAIANVKVCSSCGAPSSKAKIDPEDMICSRCRPKLKDIMAERKLKEREMLEIEEKEKRAARVHSKNAGAW